ncbi:type II toxin-antitoxin system RelE/ParE family toxin [Leuconostocaceae bacterium ESL0958]|nr:type II toxin-antitoxin system RelE/ParE family toxin [Leuconostocaceae bacterium ESL0958]
MKYRWTFDKKAEKEFSQLDRPVQIRILQWLDTMIAQSDNPRKFGKPLVGKFKTLWRYRLGKY